MSSEYYRSRLANALNIGRNANWEQVKTEFARVVKVADTEHEEKMEAERQDLIEEYGLDKNLSLFEINKVLNDESSRSKKDKRDYSKYRK